ncbi:hypothetical protein I3760_13G069700 [Carya illinoinensis]|nr:hypothetical protein I3760_13G069700 [Carya illinoinensis]
MADGPKNLLEKGAVHLEYSKNLYKVKSELKYASKSYCIEHYFEKTNNDSRVSDWNFNLHELQLCFGVNDFLVIAPQSASGVVLDAPEASKLLSAVAIALTNCSSLLPALVPVHDPSRKAYIGIQNMGTVFTRRFEADHIGTQVPVKLMHLEGLYELFISKFAYSTLDLPVHLFKVNFTMKLTYRTIPYDDDHDLQGTDAEITEPGGSPGSDTHNRVQWDDDCPWSEWYSAEDPIKGFELIALWSEKMIESSLQMAELENDSPHDAEKWILFPKFSQNLSDGSKGNQIGFSSQLHLLIDALDMSFEAPFIEDFVSVENTGPDNLKTSMIIPPPTVIDRVLKELFHEGVRDPDFAKGGHKSSRAIKGAPLQSLFVQFCLNCLWFGSCNIRAIAVLWIEFVREVRWCWEESQPLPKMPANGSIDLSTCLINQKLQMLAMVNPNNVWPPRGRLSQRMSEHGNLWRNIWNDAPALPASEQKPLLDPNREGEKVLHYLETLRPHQLLEQMVCTAFRASADTLNQTNYGGLKQMTTKMEQLYLTMASVLKPVQANRLSAGSEIFEDLRRLCGILEHVEKLLTVAASLHRKFLQAPRLSEAIFSDYYNFYLPRMRTGSVEDKVQMEFDKKQQVRIHERRVISNMFTLPTANQSWRKVLSMGNLLNGHEPILREIIFSMRDRVSGNHYAAHTPMVYQREIETYRMYICGTSNDLRVALSVVSCD